uniref:Uncharacterized protein n=1 Tax=Rhizophora mucronata TaxID=61149 RepID=A0A2P2PVP5_RHIMU
MNNQDRKSKKTLIRTSQLEKKKNGKE